MEDESDEFYGGTSKQAVADRLTVTRDVMGYDQSTFAKGAGLRPNAYNQYENAVNWPQRRAAIAICDAYLLTLDWIYRGDPSGLRYDVAAAIKSAHDLRRRSR